MLGWAMLVVAGAGLITTAVLIFIVYFTAHLTCRVFGINPPWLSHVGSFCAFSSLPLFLIGFFCLNCHCPPEYKLDVDFFQAKICEAQPFPSGYCISLDSLWLRGIPVGIWMLIAISGPSANTAVNIANLGIAAMLYSMIYTLRFAASFLYIAILPGFIALYGVLIPLSFLLRAYQRDRAAIMPQVVEFWTYAICFLTHGYCLENSFYFDYPITDEVILYFCLALFALASDHPVLKITRITVGLRVCMGITHCLAKGFIQIPGLWYLTLVNTVVSFDHRCVAQFGHAKEEEKQFMHEKKAEKL